MGDPKTLRELYLSERWRGRDNLRVSLRSLTRLADLPSVLIPIVDAAALITVLAGLLLVPFAGAGALLAAAGCTIVLAGAALRAIRMSVRGRLPSPVDWARAALVALFYDLGRACSLVWPARHRRIQPQPARSAAARTP